MPQQGKVLVESSGSRPGMQLNMLQCSAQPPTTENYLAPNVKSIEAEKLCSTPTTHPQTGFSKATLSLQEGRTGSNLHQKRHTAPVSVPGWGKSSPPDVQALPLSTPTLLALFCFVLFAKYSGKCIWATVSPTTEI